MTTRTIIIGAGHAGGEAAAQLRSAGYQGRILIVGEEAHVPYERPPLSKDLLSGDMELRRIYLRQPHFYPEHDIELMLREKVLTIDRAAHEVTAGGVVLIYDTLILATGAALKRLPVPGAGLAGIHMIRSIDDTIRLREEFHEGARLVVVGGGYIGLEAAAVARRKGLEVTVIEASGRLMARTVSPPVSSFFENLHKANGVRILLDETVAAFEGGERVTAVRSASGMRHAADLVIVGVGVAPNTGLAQAAGLAVEDGILVDAQCRTSDPDIFAIGDAARHHNPLYGQSLRLESVQNAMGQARVAALTIAGREASYAEVPWFWSNQYDLRLQIAGVGAAGDELVLRGNPGAPGFSVAYLRDGRLAALEAVGNPRDFMAAKRLIAAHFSQSRVGANLAHTPRAATETGIDKAKLADPDLPLKELLPSD